MTFDEYMALSAPENYDFSDDGANYDYRNLDDGIEKFFVYMALGREYSCEEENVMKYGSDFSIECLKKYKGVPDPDSGSMLLQYIYKMLWDSDSLIYCIDDKSVVRGDTMNSQNTTLNVVYDIIEKRFQKNERMHIKTNRGYQSISIRYILSRYAENKDKVKSLFNEFNGLNYFISNYHTLGNLIPVPVGCNSPRGTGYTKDYWDLALLRIYNYYFEIADNLTEIVGETNAKKYRSWLDSFSAGDTKKVGWEKFIENNYLHDYVNYENDFRYGKPKELWKGHFSGSVLPKEKQEIEEFYVNASCWIAARGTRMISKLRKIISNY